MFRSLLVLPVVISDSPVALPGEKQKHSEEETKEF